MEAGGVGAKLRPKTSTSNSISDSWREEIFFMALLLKLVCSSQRVQLLVLLNFLVVCVFPGRVC